MIKTFFITSIAFLIILFSISCTANQQSTSATKHDSTDVNSDTTIVNKYWKLIILEGQKITMAKNQQREIFFSLKDSNRVAGFAGCNNFGGTYTLEKGYRIRFSQMLSTMMACPDVMVNEADFLKVFELADNYSIKNDTLSLNVGRRAPLAVFEAVYFN